MDNYSLRHELNNNKEWYLKKCKKLDWQWKDEGIPYSIMDYHASMGSVLNFSEDDWKVCEEYGWSKEEVVILCETDEFHCNCCGNDFSAKEIYLNNPWETIDEICCPCCGAMYDMNDETFVKRIN